MGATGFIFALGEARQPSHGGNITHGYAMLWQYSAKARCLECTLPSAKRPFGEVATKGLRSISFLCACATRWHWWPSTCAAHQRMSKRLYRSWSCGCAGTSAESTPEQASAPGVMRSNHSDLKLLRSVARGKDHQLRPEAKQEAAEAQAVGGVSHADHSPAKLHMLFAAQRHRSRGVRCHRSVLFAHALNRSFKRFIR